MKSKLELVRFTDGWSFYQKPGADWRKNAPSYEGQTPSLEPGSFEYAGLADAIAEALPGEWETSALYEEIPSSPILFERKDGLAFSILFPGKGARNPEPASASYRRPKNPGQTSSVSLYDEAGNRISDPSIRFSASKPPAAIARDIARRLIPEAEKTHAFALTALTEQRLYLSKCEAAQACASKLNGRLGAFYFEALGTQVQIRASLTPSQALAVAATLAAYPLPEE